MAFDFEKLNKECDNLEMIRDKLLRDNGCADIADKILKEQNEIRAACGVLESKRERLVDDDKLK